MWQQLYKNVYFSFKICYVSKRMPWFLENTGGGKETSYLSLTACCSETGSQMPQAGSETAVYLRMTSNS